jgi:hypothetical protein
LSVVRVVQMARVLVVTGNGGRRPYTIKLYDNALAKHNRLAFIVDCKSTIMNLSHHIILLYSKTVHAPYFDSMNSTIHHSLRLSVSNYL